MEEARPVRERGERLYAKVYAGFLSGWGQGMCRHIGAGDAGVPAIGFPRNCDGLGRPRNRAMKANADPANLGEAEDTPIQYGPTAILRIGETVVAALALQARIAGRFAILDATEERLERLVQAPKHVLQDLRVDLGVFRASGFQVGQFRRLIVVGERDAALLPGGFPF